MYKVQTSSQKLIIKKRTHYSAFLRFISFILLYNAYNISRFPSLGIPRLELEILHWNSYVGHWNSNVGIPMSNIGITTSEFQLQRRNSEAREPTSEI